MTIPDKALQNHIAVLGKTGSGKTYAVKGVVERILDAGGRVCIVDPTGAWHGLRSGKSGKGGGYPVAIFGGAHGDLPLGGAHGDAIAEIVGTSSTPAILDTSMMKVSERTRFFADFADALVRKNRGPLHLIIDEAHLFAPQGKVSDPQSGAMLHAANNLVSLGRSRGLRIILITQRPAKLHKDSLTQVETLVAMRLIAPQDRRAVEDWIKDNADEVTGRKIIESLATLKSGEGWVWSPEIGMLDRVHFPKIKTFDSSRAPDGSDGAGPVLAWIDRDEIEQRLKAVSADAVSNDPARLKAELARLKAENAKLAAAAKDAKQVPADPAKLAEAECNAYAKGCNDAYKMIRSECDDLRESLESVIRSTIKDAVTKVASEIEYQCRIKFERTRAAPPRQPNPASAPHPTRALPSGAPPSSLPKAERKILTALAQYHPNGRTKSQVAALAGYAINGGGFNNALSSLRTQGFARDDGDKIAITDDGLVALGPYVPLPHGDALLQHWMAQLGKAEREVLRVLSARWPDSMSKEDVARESGYAAGGGGYNNALSRLRRFELIFGSDPLKASDALFG